MIIKDRILSSRVKFGGSVRVPGGTLIGYHDDEWVPADVLRGIPAERVLINTGDPGEVCVVGLGMVYELDDGLPIGCQLWLGRDGAIVYAPTTGGKNQVVGRVDNSTHATVFLG